MAATIACCPETSAISDTMPTSVPSDDANDGVNTAPVSSADSRKVAASNLANSGSSDEVGAVDVVSGPHLRSPRARRRPVTYLEATAPPGKGSTATKSKKKSSQKSSKKKGAAVTKSPSLKVFARPAVSVLTIAALAKVRAEKQKIEKEKKQKVREDKQTIEKEKKQKVRTQNLKKSPTAPFYSTKKSGIDSSGSSDCKKAAVSVPKERVVQKKKPEKVNNGKRKERSLKTTPYRKPPFVRPSSEDLVHSSESSDDESVPPSKSIKKKKPNKKSSTAEPRATPKSKKSNSLSKKTKDTKTPPTLPAEDLFEDSASSDDDSLAFFKKTRDPDNPLPICMSLCNKEDKRKTEFTMVNDPQYKLFHGSFHKSLPMFKEPSSGLFLRTYFDPNQLKGCRFRCSNLKYPFDGRKERMVTPGKHICFELCYLYSFLFHHF